MKKPNLRPYDRVELLQKADAETYFAQNYFTKKPNRQMSDSLAKKLDSFADLHEDEAFLAEVHPKYVI